MEAIKNLVQGILSSCAPHFLTMTKQSWNISQQQGVGDQSKYVFEIFSVIGTNNGYIREVISTPLYFKTYCNKLVE